jgi:hypothetical protein
VHILRAHADFGGLQGVGDGGDGDEGGADDLVYPFDLAQAITNFTYKGNGFFGRFIHFPVASNNWGTHDAPFRRLTQRGRGAERSLPTLISDW